MMELELFSRNERMNGRKEGEEIKYGRPYISGEISSSGELLHVVLCERRGGERNNSAKREAKLRIAYHFEFE